MKSLVSTSWLERNLENVKILDGSWHMPNSNRNALGEYEDGHIKNSFFFDIDKFSEQNTELPHMLPSASYWKKVISNIGIKNSDHVIIYDNSDVISSCRVWYNFLYFGHDPNLVSVLDGGLKKWLNERKKITKNQKTKIKTDYIVNENLNLVLNKKQIELNIEKKSFELIDARSEKRFLGLEPEPRKELKSGKIEGSKNVPFKKIINKDHSFKSKDEIKEIFETSKSDLKKDIAFTCGSGITACVLGLANSIISGKSPIIYDGSWSEYGLK